ncbi:hypothetical protein CDL12_21167 [Handroanthus impetiginosus]|uniref:PHD Zn-finger protein n=1 Tax=Handroanthus impetiginosus TaxID=429701 RepID=A0A2G9GLY4_9LAMI|nr:hypothetical protein CDL12_21167 [Handroanthus impetiginosus]
MAMNGEPSPHSSSNKRMKTLISTPDPPPQSSPSFISKGKTKVLEGTSLPTQNEVEIESADCCGICLSEARNGGVSRGYIDCCKHYFCFVCIMEWAKVESKCPLCKRRFSSIRRPPKPPIFPSERVVHVPVRDQVYHYFGNATISPPDPYAEAKCSVCHGIEDESFLLLCDLCDSAAHTYCIGLGVTVPEGDWFCQDCTLLRDEHLKSETNTDSDVQISSDVAPKISANEHVSVFDIVQEPFGLQIPRSRRASSDQRPLPPPSSPDDETDMLNNIDRTSSARREIAPQHSTKPNARTLRHCRNLHDRIRVLRENWNGFRSGILQFSSGPGDGNISSQKSVNCKSRQNSASCLNQQSTAQCSSADMTKAHEIEKAWKMMNKAKSIKQGHEGSTIVRQASKCAIRKQNVCKDADYTSYRHSSSDKQQNGSTNVGSTRTGKDYCKQPSSVSAKQKWRWHMTEDVTNWQGSSVGHSPTQREAIFIKGVRTPSDLHNASVGSSEKPQAEKSINRHTCLTSSVMSEPVALDIDHAERMNHACSSHSKVERPKEKSKLKKITIDSQQYNDARSEIQSLVKLNIKLQTRGEKLEVDAFKEVARLATHIILAACGLEHPKQPGPCTLSGMICSHSREVQRSSLMPNSCRECFYVFVKNIVDTVILQKKRTHKKQ